jgi:hypothetical protein
MGNTTIRVSSELLDNIKLLKDTTQVKAYEEVLQHLVKQELKKYYVRTKLGRVQAGAVVNARGVVLVITKVTPERVFFDDGSYALNGGKYTYDLELVAESVEEYAGGRTRNE